MAIGDVNEMQIVFGAAGKLPRPFRGGFFCTVANRMKVNMLV